VLQLLDIYIYKYLRKLGEFQPTKYSQSQLADNYKLRQKKRLIRRMSAVFLVQLDLFKRKKIG